MMSTKMEAIKKRLGRIEPVEPVVIWPPREGSLEYCIWESMGQPMEPRRTFEEFYNMMAEEVWKRETSTEEFGEGAEEANDSQD
jgi:hypothetical protein